MTSDAENGFQPVDESTWDFLGYITALFILLNGVEFIVFSIIDKIGLWPSDQRRMIARRMAAISAHIVSITLCFLKKKCVLCFVMLREFAIQK